MLHLEVIAVGTRPPDWISAGMDDYARRMSRACRFNIVEVANVSRKNASRQANMREEGRALSGKLNTGARKVALDPGGRIWSTGQLADRISSWSQMTSHVQFVIGGSDGLSAEVLAACDEHWSLSHLTFPHFLVRVLIAEQLYRALMLNANHPYHK